MFRFVFAFGIFCLTFGDGFAALLGHRWGKIHIRKNKTLLGFISCFCASFTSIFLFRIFYLHTLTITEILIIAYLSSVAELTENGLDNISITLSTFVTGYMFTTSVNDSYRIGLLIALTVFTVVFFSKAITYSGSVLPFQLLPMQRLLNGDDRQQYTMTESQQNVR